MEILTIKTLSIVAVKSAAAASYANAKSFA